MGFTFRGVSFRGLTWKGFAFRCLASGGLRLGVLRLGFYILASYVQASYFKGFTFRRVTYRCFLSISSAFRDVTFRFLTLSGLKVWSVMFRCMIMCLKQMKGKWKPNKKLDHKISTCLYHLVISLV